MISHHPPNQNQPVDSDKFAFLNLRVLPGKSITGERGISSISNP
jgi:hypothetical protein